MSKIFITGADGFIGSNVFKRFKELDPLIVPREKLDLKDFEKLKRVVKENRVDFIINCAGVNGGIVFNKKYPATLFYENMAIVNNLFKLVEMDIKVINLASSCIYPKNSPQPIKEEYLCEGKMEETSIGYSSAKLAGVLATIAYNKQFGKKILSLIPNTVYGPNAHFDENAHVLTALIKKFVEAKDEVVLWGDGEVYREFIYVEDLADAIYFAYKNFEKIKEDYLNVGSGEEVKIKDLAEMIATKVSFKGKVKWDTSKPKGVFRKLLDSSKFRSYGWEVNTPLGEGIEKTLRWYRANER